MSEWIEINDQYKVELSDDKKTIDVYFESNDSGRRYIEIPIDYVIKCLEDANIKCEKP